MKESNLRSTPSFTNSESTKRLLDMVFFKTNEIISGLELLKQLGETWDYFFKEILPILQAILYPLTSSLVCPVLLF